MIFLILLISISILFNRYASLISLHPFLNLLISYLQIQYSWLWKLANVTQSPYSYIWSNDTGPELVNGPSRKSMYVTALYFTMTCMTSVIYCLRLVLSVNYLAESTISHSFFF